MMSPLLPDKRLEPGAGGLASSEVTTSTPIVSLTPEAAITYESSLFPSLSLSEPYLLRTRLLLLLLLLLFASVLYISVSEVLEEEEEEGIFPHFFLSFRPVCCNCFSLHPHSLTGVEVETGGLLAAQGNPCLAWLTICQQP